MNLAWFTPFSTASAIGRFSQAVTGELSKHVRVDLWVSGGEDLLPTSLPVLDYNPEVPLAQWWPQASYDFAVCHFGDFLDYHRRIFEFSRKVPSVAVLHDFVMQHFFAGYYQLVVKDLDAHLRRIEALYGEPAREWNARALRGETPWVWETADVVRFPMFEDCISGALGVVTHSRFFREKVERVFPGPVEDIPLAYPIHRDPPAVPRQALPVPAGRLLLLTVGNVNRNKRAEEVVEAIAADRAVAAKVFYLICGQVEPAARERLQGLIANRRLEDTVRLHGRVSASELHSLFLAADICINLRNPAMEGGSASLAEMMLYGKPGIVSDTGVYAEVPDGCVLKVRPEHEHEDLAAALASLVNDPGARRRLGVRAREHAEANFTPAAYAQRLLAFLDDLRTLKPVLDPVHRAARMLNDFNIPPEMEIGRTVAGMAADLFCGPAGRAPWNRRRE